jgi:type IV pilus biogenesis protein CpaD/CtpE
MRVLPCCAGVVALLCAACAGRDPQPVATVQITDSTATCAMIVAEIEANNVKVKELAGEEGAKVAQQQYLTTLATERCGAQARAR